MNHVIEFWLMRVIHVQPKTAGDYVQLASGELLEPLQLYETEAEAQHVRRAMLDAYPAEDFRVILNTNIGA